MTYSRVVRWLKIGLPLIALAILSSLFLLPRKQGLEGGLIYSTADLIAIGEGMVVSNPKFTGSTDAGEPFVVSATSATPDGPDPKEVKLASPRASLDQDERSVELTAASGVLAPRDGRLSLGGGVELTTSDGYVVRTDAVFADFRAGTMQAAGHVVAKSPHGMIEAGSFRAENPKAAEKGADAASGALAKSGRFWFENGVRVTYDPRPQEDAPQQGDAQ